MKKNIDAIKKVLNKLIKYYISGDYNRAMAEYYKLYGGCDPYMGVVF